MKNLGIILLFIAAIISITALITLVLWNEIVVSLFQVEPITFWTALGINMIIGIISGIFKSK